jgi:TRAP-type mannitol/chloroaromatic compound transport system permease small subunit
MIRLLTLTLTSYLPVYHIYSWMRPRHYVLVELLIEIIFLAFASVSIVHTSIKHMKLGQTR